MAIGVLPKKIRRGLGDKAFTMDTKIMGIRGARGLRELRVVTMEDTSAQLEPFR